MDYWIIKQKSGDVNQQLYLYIWYRGNKLTCIKTGHTHHVNLLFGEMCTRDIIVAYVRRNNEITNIHTSHYYH